MRIVLIALLLTGCSVAELRGNQANDLEEQKGNARILFVEQECAGNGYVIGTPGYDKCLDEELKDEPQLIALLDRLRAEFAQRAANGTTEDDRRCQSFGYYRGTPEYNICLEYARDNRPGGTGKMTSRK